MNKEEIRQAIDAITLTQQLFRHPSSTAEEEINHLLDFILKRMQTIHKGKSENLYESNK